MADTISRTTHVAEVSQSSSQAEYDQAASGDTDIRNRKYGWMTAWCARLAPSIQSAPAAPVNIRQQEFARAMEADGVLPGGTSSFSDMLAFMREEREMMMSAMEKQRVEMQALLDQAQMTALQVRVQALHATQLLTDEELYRIEDVIADGCEVNDVRVGTSADGRGEQVARMVALSARVAVEGAFARQLRRKFVGPIDERESVFSLTNSVICQTSSSTNRPVKK
jgi:hypothetical protein